MGLEVRVGGGFQGLSMGRFGTVSFTQPGGMAATGPLPSDDPSQVPFQEALGPVKQQM